jgi:hypothetical protein
VEEVVVVVVVAEAGKVMEILAEILPVMGLLPVLANKMAPTQPDPDPVHHSPDIIRQPRYLEACSVA